jgi:hypothetical protein
MAVALKTPTRSSLHCAVVAERTPVYEVAPAGSAETVDGLFGIWKDRTDLDDVDGFVRRLRSRRHG